MKKGKITFSLFFAFFFLQKVSDLHAEETSFTREDKERLIRLEVKLEEGLKATNQRIDEISKSLNQRIDEGLKSVNQRIDDLINLMLWGFGILFGGMGLLIGFVIWDRRTALAPAVKRIKELEEKEEKIERAFKEIALKDPKIAEILRSVGFM